MPKWKSVLVEEEKQLGNGKVKPGRTVPVPLDDAAMAHPLAEEALAAGLWTPKSPNAIAEAKERLRLAQEKEDRRRGILPPK